MKIVFYSREGKSAGYAYRLLRDGHEVWLYTDDAEYSNIFKGTIPRINNSSEILKIKPDFVVFDRPGFGQRADTLKKLGIKTLFSSMLSDSFHEKFWQQETATKIGLKLPKEHKKYTQVSVMMWFDNGEPCYPGLCSLRTTRFLTGNLGKDTECQTVVMFPFSQKEPRLVQEHKRLWYMIKVMGWSGPVTINLLVSNSDIYFKSIDFGLVFSDFYAFLELCCGDIASPLNAAKTMKISTGFAYSVNISIPPYPNPVIKSMRMPEVIYEKVDISNIWFNDVVIVDNRVMVAGTSGLVATITAKAPSIQEVNQVMKDRLYHILIPDKQYRIDGAKVAEKDYQQLFNNKLI